MKNKITSISGVVLSIFVALKAFNVDFDTVYWADVVQIVTEAVISVVLFKSADPGKENKGGI